MDKIRAGMEKGRPMRDTPHVIRVQIENTRAHTAILERSSSGEDTRVAVTVVGCVATTTVVLANCGWKLYAR